jgi:hypothetical protein
MVKVRRSLTAISVMLAVCLPLASLQAAPVFDGYFQVEQKKNAEGWAAEDTKINEKLAELEKRFGKKPNIIYILADDPVGGNSAGKVVASTAARPPRHWIRWPKKEWRFGRLMQNRPARHPE